LPQHLRNIFRNNINWLLLRCIPTLRFRPLKRTSADKSAKTGSLRNRKSLPPTIHP